jgi:hypothetical protein
MDQNLAILIRKENCKRSFPEDKLRKQKGDHMGRIPICAFAALVGISVLRFAPSAQAVDGVTLIKQATATNGLPGCGTARKTS